MKNYKITTIEENSLQGQLYPEFTIDLLLKDVQEVYEVT